MIADRDGIPSVEDENLGCCEYVEGGSNGMRSVRYLKPAELAAHPERSPTSCPHAGEWPS